MSLVENHHLYERLSKGVTNRAHFNDPALSIKKIFQKTTLAFNNEEVVMQLPGETYDVDNINALD